MDDMRNTQASLYGKAEPATAKTTMSVREMQHLLGLGKTDSYWLLHKNFFEVILINDKMRIVISIKMFLNLKRLLERYESILPALKNGTPIRSNIIRSMVLHRARNFASGHILFWKLLKY